MSIIQAIEKNKQFSEWRRSIHQNPELAYEEFDTSDFVAKLLEEWGIEVHRNIGKTGVVGVLKGKKDTHNKAISLRADMDALPIHEDNDFDHKSKNDGKMHACGHDGHTAMLLAAAQHLAKTRDFDGTVNFVFQPAEEGHAGAKAMIDDGLFDRFPCDQIFGMHNWPGLPAGYLSLCEKGMTAASDKVFIKISGKGGHGAMPHNNTDCIVTGAELVMSLQTLVSRKVKPLSPAVVTIGTFNAGVAVNAMPEMAELSASVRTFDRDTQDLIEREIAHIAKHIGAAHHVDITVDYKRGYPAVYNDSDAVRVMHEACVKTVGEENCDTAFEPTMASEDFAFFLQVKKGAYIVMGQGEGHKQLHNSHYDFNDDTLHIGASFWVNLVEHIL